LTIATAFKTFHQLDNRKGLVVSDYGKKYSGSGTARPYSTMGRSSAPWNPDRMEDVEVTTEITRGGRIGPLLDKVLPPKTETHTERRYVR
jgi:hypothetical protein